MRFFTTYVIACFVAASAFAQDAPPVQYFGQDSPLFPSYELQPNGGAVTARNAFVESLADRTVGSHGFESDTPHFINNLPSRVASALFQTATMARFPAYGDGGEIPVVVKARNRGIIELDANLGLISHLLGAWPTGGNKYLFAAGYDYSILDVVNEIFHGTTHGAVRLEYAPGQVSAGKVAKPISAFGTYVTDIEGYETIRLTLTPLGGGAPVVLDYGEVTNLGVIELSPGNGQVAFIGFTDHDSQYEAIEISFTDRRVLGLPIGSTVVDNETFGFDDFIIGEINQVQGPEITGATPPVLSEPGWRLLSAPVQGVTVDDLAQQNVVLGVPDGDGVEQAQYPNLGYNLYSGYQGGARWDYVPAPTTGTVLRPGRGFWWYWYDQAFTPNDPAFGPGTSVSVELDGFQLSATGTEISDAFSETFEDNTNCASDQETCTPPFTTPNADPTTVGAPEGSIAPDDDDFYLFGNPFPYPMDYSAMSVTGGTLAAQGFIWNPGNPGGLNPRTGDVPELDGPGTYEIVFDTPPPSDPNDPTPQGAVSIWNGVLVEVTKTAGEVGDPVTVTYDPVLAATPEVPPFHGKTAAPEAYARFGLFGETASGAKTRDEATYIRFLRDATLGWDRTDASKPSWPSGPVGLIAPMGERDGEPMAQAVMALPEGAAGSSVPLSVQLTEAGEYTLVWRSMRLSGTLVDIETGAQVDLASTEGYTFTAQATGEDWVPRFVLTAAVTAVVDTEQTPEASGAYVGAPMPNPAAGAFALDVRLGAAAEATVSVYDALGRRVAEQAVRLSASGESVRVSTAGFAPGAYLVVVEAPGVRETRRVTVLR
ncbi:T9SS type A sorting domain-containing protein [Rubricoccus marinus]|uniref:Secretion system C-terminal sorting domain-containing protein n=1 Tax=Rubricoccus marinus TaxID=716817 RepID=A0A259TW67_9BACT|nr:T9SS type A sorting domain-containing protein [Rubricoccus marinus]OZC01798.1 hypothetical protein BSZ36_01620 [Rubricoccus marinus]